MKRNSLLVMLLVALFVPLAMNAQNEMLTKGLVHSSQQQMKSAPATPMTMKSASTTSLTMNAQNEMLRENGIVRSQLEPREILNITPLNEPGRLTLTVNQGNQTNAYIPIPRSYVNTGDTETQFILSASSLSGLVPDGYYANITGLSFTCNNQNASFGTYYVLIQEGSFDGSGFFYSVNDMTIAYYGSLSASRGTMSFTFNQLADGFDYFGGDLMICFYQTAAGTNNTRLNWNGVTASGMAAYWNGSSGALANFLPQTTFTYTRVEASCVVPADLDLFAIDKTAAGLYWTERGQSTQWEVSYSTTSGDPDNGTIVPVTEGEPYCILTGLTEGTIYYAYVRSICDGDTPTDWSAGIGFRTPGTCDQPSDVAVSNVSQTSADVSWYGYDESYDVRYRKQSAGHDIANFINHQVGNTTTTSSTATDYTFSLNSYSGNGYIAIRHYNVSDMFWLDVYTVTVKDARGNVVFTGDLTNGIPDGWFTVDYDDDGYNWNATTGFVYSESYSNDVGPLNPDNWLITPQVPLGGSVVINAKGQDANYPSEKFGVFVSTTAIVEYPWTTVEDVEGESNAIAGLNPETTYEVQVRAHSCPGDWSNAVTFTTLSGCDAPGGLTTTNITGTTATLNWAEAVNEYNVRYMKGFIYDFESAEPWAVDNFAPCTTYDGDNYETYAFNSWTFPNAGYTGACIAFNNNNDGSDNMYSHSGDAFGVMFNAGSSSVQSNDWFILPELKIESGDSFSFWCREITDQYGAETINVGIYGSANGTFSAYLAQNVSVSSTDWTEFSYDLSSYAGQTIRLAINCVSRDIFGIMIDDIFVGNPNGWSDPITVTGATYTLTGLSMNTNYVWQVQGVDCDGNGSTTDWSSASFTTLDGILVESISADDVTVTVGETASITHLEVLPADATNPAVTYTSNDETIATVENGVVTGVAPGTTTITIAATDGSGVTYDITVTVNGIDVTGITASDITMITGETATISYTVTPDDATDQSVTFTSANTAIATVDADGVVTGVGAGETTITIASVSNPEITAEITVTVTSDPNAVLFTVNAPATAHPGDVITVAGVLTAPTSGTYGGFTDLLMAINYDHNAFAFVTGSIVYGPVVEQAQQYGSQITNFTNVTDKIQVAINCYEEGYYVTAEGIVFSAQFTVLAETGEFTFTGEPNGYMNFDHEIEGGGGVEYILYEATPSTVEITSFETYTKHITGYGTSAGGYYLIASPLATDVDPEDVTNMLTADEDNYHTYDLFYFDQAGDSNGNEWINYRVDEFDLVSGKGYLYANKHDVDLIFTGAASTETEIQVPLEVKDCSDASGHFVGWNLVGNPFGHPAYTDRDFYVMNTAGTQIVLDEGNRKVDSIQGIFVIATTDGEEMTFTTTNPSNAGSKVVMNVMDNQGLADRAIVRFGEGSQLPKFQLFGNTTKLYFPEDDQDYAVVRSANENELPVNFKASSNGTYTMSVNIEDVDMDYIHLIDNQTRMDVDLLQTPNYTFEATTSDSESRFLLVFATVDGVNENHFGFINASGNLCIYGVEGKATLQVIDVLGHVLSTEQFSGSYEKHLNVAPGVYMIRLIQGNDSKVQKMVVR